MESMENILPGFNDLCREKFNEMDKDSSGTIELLELYSYFKEGLHNDEINITNIMSAFDSNKDNVLSYDEFQLLFLNMILKKNIVSDVAIADIKQILIKYNKLVEF